MGNDHTCPRHSGNSLTKICMCDSCLEPLCSKCLTNHISIHRKLGYEPKIQDYSSVKKEMGKQSKLQKSKDEKIMESLVPASLQIKDLNHEYF